MPIAAPTPCRHPGCNVLVRDGSGYCATHLAARRRIADENRGSASKRHYGRAWQRAREGFLRAHPLCQCDECDEGRKRLRPSVVVDHRIPHRGDMSLFWDSSNWQALAKECHDRKTAREDGGFGNPRRG